MAETMEQAAAVRSPREGGVAAPIEGGGGSVAGAWRAGLASPVPSSPLDGGSDGATITVEGVRAALKWWKDTKGKEKVYSGCIAVTEQTGFLDLAHRLLDVFLRVFPRCGTGQPSSCDGTTPLHSFRIRTSYQPGDDRDGELEMNTLLREDKSLAPLFGGAKLKTPALAIAILSAGGVHVTTTPQRVNPGENAKQPGVVFGHNLPSRTATPPAPKAGRHDKVTTADLATLLERPSPALLGDVLQSPDGSDD
eukprot:1257282-Prymnesium_polylepis.1